LAQHNFEKTQKQEERVSYFLVSKNTAF